MEREDSADGPGIRARLAGRPAAHGLPGRARRFQLGRLLPRGRSADRRTRRSPSRTSGLNPTRTGLLAVLERMGADIEVEACRRAGPEPVGRITARTSDLVATDVERGRGARTSSTSCRSSCSRPPRREGVSRLRGAAELRAKESDRLRRHGRPAPGPGGRGGGVSRRHGRHGRPEGWAGGAIATEADHRVAMVGAIAGAASARGRHRRRRSTASPCRIPTSSRRSRGVSARRRAMIIAIDGPGGLGQEHHRPGSREASGHALPRHGGHVPHRHAAGPRGRAGARSHPRGGRAGRRRRPALRRAARRSHPGLHRRPGGHRRDPRARWSRRTSRRSRPTPACGRSSRRSSAQEAAQGDVVLEGRDMGTVVVPRRRCQGLPDRLHRGAGPAPPGAAAGPGGRPAARRTRRRHRRSRRLRLRAGAWRRSARPTTPWRSTPPA